MIKCDDIDKCSFCEYLRRFSKVKLIVDDSNVYFLVLEYANESKICWESVNPLCKKSEYKRNSREYLEKTIGKEITEKKIKSRSDNMKGRYTEKWFIKKYGELEGKNKRQEYIDKLSKMSTKEGFIEKYGIEDGTNRWQHFTDQLKFKRDESYFVNKYGEELGKEKYKETIENRSFRNTREYFVEKFGEEGNKRFNNKICNLDKYIQKFGEVEGPIKYKEYCESKNINLDNLVKKYGEDEGKRKFDEFRDKSKITLENMILRYGEEIGKKKYEEFREKLKGKCNLQWYINKYGEEEGKRRHEKFRSIVGVRLYRYIDKYGEVEGTIKFNEYIKKISVYRYSKISQELFWKIYEKNKDHNIFFHELNTEFSIKREDNRYYFLDFFDSTINKCIEFNGDYFHANKNRFKENDVIDICTKTAGEIWEEDERKLNYIKSKNIEVLVIWEYDFRSNKEETINKCFQFLGVSNDS